MSSTILVVGGAGYVGSHVVLELLQKDWNVVVVDNVSNCCCRKPERLQKVEYFTSKKVKYYSFTIQDKNALHSVFNREKIDCVIHLATLKNSMGNPLKLYQNDVVGTICLLETMKQHKVNKIIFSSTVFVYTLPDVLPITEIHETGYHLPTAFSRSKHMIEELLKDLCTSDNAWTAIVLRHASPVAAHKCGGLGNKLIKGDVEFIARHIQLGENKIFICREEYESFCGEGMRDYLHVCDVAAAYELAADKTMLSSFRGFAVYNLSSGAPHTFLDVLEKMSIVSGVPVMYEIVEEGRAEPALYVSGELAEKELGWKAKKNLNDICRDTLSCVEAKAPAVIANPLVKQKK